MAGDRDALTERLAGELIRSRYWLNPVTEADWNHWRAIAKGVLASEWLRDYVVAQVADAERRGGEAALRVLRDVIHETAQAKVDRAYRDGLMDARMIVTRRLEALAGDSGAGT